jgi:hypothetical protein
LRRALLAGGALLSPLARSEAEREEALLAAVAFRCLFFERRDRLREVVVVVVVVVDAEVGRHVEDVAGVVAAAAAAAAVGRDAWVEEADEDVGEEVDVEREVAWRESGSRDEARGRFGSALWTAVWPVPGVASGARTACPRFTALVSC